LATEQELLNQIIADPPADDPRLEYAQVVEAGGDPRGAFIRMQIAKLRLTPQRRSPQWFLAASESSELEAAHGEQWAAPVREMKMGYEFERGFVGLVRLTARQFLEQGPQLYSLAPVLHLDITVLGDAAGDFFASPLLCRIRSLSINQCRLGDHEMRILADSPRLGELRWLSVALNDIGLPGIEAMAASHGLPLLRYVNFYGNPVNPTDQFDHDQGVIVDSWRTKEGAELEEGFGRIAWLHPTPQTMDELQPNRFYTSLE
jgi:uncharacterized protein (TIGR02996 family)